MKFLIAGLGSIGRRHLRNLLALGERDILLYRSGKGVLPETAQAELADFPIETDLQTALASRLSASCLTASCQMAVIVSNPTALHLDVAIPALQAGCHVLLEKPISNSWERIAELQTAAAQAGSKVLVGYQYRYHPGLLKAREVLQSGMIGRALSVRAHWGEYLPGWHPGEDYRAGYSARADLGGGVVLTLSHPFDYLRWLLGEVEAVWAFTGQISDLELSPGVEDSAEIGLRFANGVLGSLHLDYNQRPPAHRLEIIGTQGTIRWENESGTTSVYSAESGSWLDFRPPPGFERNDLFLAQMRHFIEIIQGQGEPICGLDDGIRALELALAVFKSQAKGQRVQLQRR